MNEIHKRGDLNLFRVFAAIAEEGSTMAAAERLNLSQSAISHALKRLRELLNDPLFVKDGRNLVLTPHGRDILPTVTQSLSNLASCTAKSGVFEPVKSEMTFNLGFRDILEFLLLPHLVAPIRNAGSKLIFNSHRIAIDDMEEALLAGKFDVVIDLEYPTSDRISSIEVTREYLCSMVGPAHTSYHSGELTIDTFSSSYHALVTLDKRERAYVDQRIGGMGAKRKVLLHCEQFFPAARTVANSDLILTMPYSYAHHLAQLIDVRLLPLPFPCEPLPVRMYWRDETSSEPYMEWLCSTLQRLFAHMPEYPFNL